MHSRRAILALGAAAVAGAAGCGGEDEDEEREARAAADLEIVRYLLRLERVEVAFWEQAAQRADTLADAGAADLARDIARNERRHVESLERWAARLGSDGGEAVRTDFGSIFAAGPEEVLGTGATLENLAAAAYLGQLNRIQDGNLLAAMLAVHSVEGRQAAAVNRLAGRGFSLGTGHLEGATPDGAFAEPMSMADVRRELKRYTGGRG